MSMEIILADKNAYFAPGQAIDGDLVWNFPKAPRWLELRLFWYTEGKGTQDEQALVSWLERILPS